VAHQSILTGFLISIRFLGAGKSVFALPGITAFERRGAKGLGKVFSLLLAAFAVMMIRIGIKGWMDLISR
jgi:hypothetical protein